MCLRRIDFLVIFIIQFFAFVVIITSGDRYLTLSVAAADDRHPGLLTHRADFGQGSRFLPLQKQHNPLM